MKSIIIIPTYNEAENIRELISEILNLKLNLDILVIDDNSPDGTAEIVEKISQKNKGIFLIKRKRKLGLGTAYSRGFKFALSKKYDFVLTMDADFSHHPRFLKRFLEVPADFDLVIGSRYIKGGKISGWEQSRHDLSKLANFITRFALGLRVKDTTSGFRRYSRKFLKNLNFKNVVSSGYAFQVEMVFLAKRLGLNVAEIPITFYERRRGQSKISGEVWRSTKILFKLFIRRRGVRQLVKFATVGFSNLIIDFGTLNLLVLTFKQSPYVSGAISSALALSWSFYWNRRWTFRSKSKEIAKEYFKFAAIGGFGTLLNYLIFSALIYYFGLWYNLAKGLAVIITTFWNFFGSKYLVFKKTND